MGRIRSRVAVLAVAALAASVVTVILPQPASADIVNPPVTKAEPLPTPVSLPFSTYGDIEVDAAAGYVFISGSNDVVVANTAGHVVKTITGETGATRMAIDPATNSLFVTLWGGHAISEISISTLTEVKRFAMGTACPEAVAVESGTVWFTASCSTTYGEGTGDGDLQSLDPSTGTVVDAGDQLKFYDLYALPSEPGVIAAVSGLVSDERISLVDVTGASPTVAATTTDGNPGGSVVESPDGSQLWSNGQVWNVADMSYAGNAPGYGRDTTYVAFLDGFTAEATGAEGDVISVVVLNPGDTTELRAWSLSDVWDLASSSTNLYAVDSQQRGVFTLYTFAGANHTTSTLTASTVRDRATGATTVSGKLTFGHGLYDGTVRTLSLTRVDATGATVTSQLSTTTSGTYSFTDPGPGAGRVGYTVSYSGDTNRAGSSATVGVSWTMPYDMNGDGFADLAAGSPLEDIGSVKDAGSFYEMFSSAAGVTGSGSKEFDQGTASVPGVVETTDQMGYSQMSGDFNGDGYADLAVSSNAETVGSVKYAGTVTIFYGSPTGLQATGSKLISPPKPTADGFFGSAMAAGDFNGDGYIDLAIGQGTTGDVYVSLGGKSGLSTSLTDFRKSTSGVPGADQKDELFGFSLAAGDINADGYADLAIGAPFDYDDEDFSAGAATLLYGSTLGLTGTGSQRFTTETPGVPGSEHTFNKDMPDDFGWQVELADFNGDGHADLAVGAPGAPVTTSDGVKHEDAGTVTILYASGSKIGTTNSTEVTQSTAGMPGNPGKSDEMGWTMTTGDSNGDGYADLAIYSPGDYYVTIVQGGASGLSYSTAVAFTENSAGIAGSDHSGDDWGGSLRFESFKGAGPQGLAVGADGTSSGKGSVTVLYSSISGLTGTGSTYLDQNSSGVPGTAEAGDAMGSFFSS